MDKGVVLGHASYAANRVGSFFGAVTSTESMEKQVEALQEVVAGQKKIFSAINESIKSEAMKGKTDLHYGNFNAAAVKAMQSVIGDLNAGREVTGDSLKTAFTTMGMNDDDVAKFYAATGLSEATIGSNIKNSGYLQKVLDGYLKSMTDEGMDRLFKGEDYAKFKFGDARTEYGKLQDAITEAFSKAPDAMAAAGYQRSGEVFTAKSLKEHNKVEFDASGQMTAESSKSLENAISTLKVSIDERKKEEQRNAGKKNEDNKK